MPSRRSSATRAKISSTIMGARPSVGSSTSSRRGVPTSTRAMASICCSPPDSVVPICRRRCASVGKRSKARSSARAFSARGRPAACMSPRRRFSSTVRPGKILRSSGTRPIPRRHTLSGGSAAMSVEPKRIEPDVRSTQRAMVLTRVLLPTPLRPNTPSTSPCAMESETPCRICDRP